MHQKKIGEITAKVLKVIPKEGSFIVRNLFPGFLLMPFLPLIKFFRTITIFLRYQPKTIVKNPLVLVPFAIGLVYWAIGFAKGKYKKRD
jgi:hypothetical protein